MGGRVVVLGNVGDNFGQGMSGGVAYIFPDDVEQFKAYHALETLDFDALSHPEEFETLKNMLEEHAAYTGSKKAKAILADFDNIVDYVVKVIPKDYKLMMHKLELHHRQTENSEQAVLNAFYDSSTEVTSDEPFSAVY